MWILIWSLTNNVPAMLYTLVCVTHFKIFARGFGLKKITPLLAGILFPRSVRLSRIFQQTIPLHWIITYCSYTNPWTKTFRIKLLAILIHIAKCRWGKYPYCFTCVSSLKQPSTVKCDYSWLTVAWDNKTLLAEDIRTTTAHKIYTGINKPELLSTLLHSRNVL